MITAYLGPMGSYSSLAVAEITPNAEKKEYHNFYSVFNAVEKGEANQAVLPIENALQGSVCECLDLLSEHKNLLITAQKEIKIEHRLIIKKGSSIDKITDLYSKEEAIKQCGRFLSENLPNVKIHYTDSTAAGLQMINKESDACIAGSHIVKEGLTALPQSVSDYPNNSTCFVLIEKKVQIKNSKKIFISFGSENKAGALLDILSVLKERGYNMTKIESRPLKTVFGEYMFFVEFEGNISENKTIETIKIMSEKSINFRLLGAY